MKIYLAITCGVLTCLPYLVTIYLKKFYDKKKQNIIGREQNCEAFSLFVTPKNKLCGDHLNKRRECGPKCSLKYLRVVLNAIKSAKSTVSVCMYHLTMEDIAESIIEAHARGVTVRCATDRIMVNCSGSKMLQFKKIGIPVKVQSPRQSNLHHKFVMIDEYMDDNMTVLFGSINYTLQGFRTNWDCLTKTNNAAIVAGFRNEFEQLWEVLEALEN